MKTIIFATTNKDKVREIKEITADKDVNVLTMSEIDFTEEIEEDGETFVDNATIKAKAVYEFAKNNSSLGEVVVLADDSGLEIDYYGGKPGVYSHRWLGEKTYPEKMQEVINDMKDVPVEKRGARFVCAMAAYDSKGELYTTRQTVEGRVHYEIIGENGFGYDPFFYVEEYGCTTAQMSPEKKNEISHRGKALRSILNILSDAGVI